MNAVRAQGSKPQLLLSPESVLGILRDFNFLQTVTASGYAVTRKVVPRYPQVEAVEAVVARVKDPTRHKGLIWHHQGSGKTLAMAFASAKLRRDLALKAPTIVVVLDRINLYEQVAGEFFSAGVPALMKAETSSELRSLLRGDQRGVVITTIFRFKDARLLSERRIIVVMVDEAHRTQEGRLGEDMREALPNANFIGLTGTPVSDRDRNTWDMFGDPDDPEGVLNRYTPERSIADGATLPVHVETRLQSEHIRQVELDQAYAELVEEEGLDDEQAEVLARKAGSVSVWFSLPGRVETVAADIVQHYRSKVAPLGLKAQVVVYGRGLCVAYKEQIDRLLTDSEESTVVMTVNAGKDMDPPEWQEFDRDRAGENAIKDRFRNPDDPLCFLIVTAKLLTGFDAPIEGVLYLVKPLKGAQPVPGRLADQPPLHQPQHRPGEAAGHPAARPSPRHRPRRRPPDCRRGPRHHRSPPPRAGQRPAPGVRVPGPTTGRPAPAQARRSLGVRGVPQEDPRPRQGSHRRSEG